MRWYKVFSALTILLTGVSHAQALSAVDISPNLVWLCEDGLSIAFGDRGLRVRMDNPPVDELLTFHGCHSSHCAWQTTGEGPDCDYTDSAPVCAVVTAGEKWQYLILTGYLQSGIEVGDAVCVSIKHKEYWYNGYAEGEEDEVGAGQKEERNEEGAVP